MSNSTLPRGPGLFEVARANGENVVTNVRRLAGADRERGWWWIVTATTLLIALMGGLMFVSFQAQYTYIFAVKHVSVSSAIEAAMLDAGMVILSALGIGLALAGKASKAERLLIMACAAASAYMNYLAADVSSLRSVVAYTAAPVFLAVVTDRVISVIRRHVLPDDTESAWQGLGRALAAAARVAAVIALYALRAALAPASTGKGLRRMVLDAAPLPGTDSAGSRHDGSSPSAIDTPPTKKAALLALYREHPDYGNRAAASKVAAELAPQAGLQPGTARAYLYAELDGRAS
jgi:hypothetical protein